MWARLLLLSLLLLLAGCQPRTLDVGVSGRIDNVLFTISLPRGLFEFQTKPTDVRQIEVRDWSLLAANPRTSQPQPQMWMMQSDSCQPSISQVRYGAAVQGFTVTTPAQPLREGGSYMIGIEGCHALHSVGIATFRIVNGRAVEVRWQ